MVETDEKEECEHKIVLAIYKDKEHKEISHYRCANCGIKIYDEVLKK